MEIRKLFTEKMLLFSEEKNIPLSHENNAFSQTSGQYLEIFVLPAANQSETFGKELESGICQINAYTPSNSGAIAMDKLVGEIMALFKTGSKTGDYIHLPATSRSQGFKTETHYCVAISINYMRLK